MATQGNKNSLRGAIGPVIFQPRNGQTIVRSKPVKVRQTVATKSSGNEFRHCSTWSKNLRLGLQPLWLGLTDSMVSQRLTSVLYAALKNNTALPKGERTVINSSLPAVVGFEANSASLFGNYCRVEPAVVVTANRTIQVTVPELVMAAAIVYPDRCTEAELKVCVTATNVVSGEFITADILTFTLNKSTNTLAAQVAESKVLPAGTVIVVAAQIVYYDTNIVRGRFTLNSKKLNPSAILLASV